MSEELRRCKGSTVEVQNTKAAIVTKVDVNHGGKDRMHLIRFLRVQK